jgi:hypothetical protein
MSVQAMNLAHYYKKLFEPPIIKLAGRKIFEARSSEQSSFQGFSIFDLCL